MPYLDDVLNPYQSLTGDLTPEDTLTGLLSEDGLLQGALAISDVVGVTELTELTDVSITNPLNNDVLTYNEVTEKWENMPAQGGGGGTSDYEDLDNKPSINSVTLTGNQTTSTLGLFSGDYDDLTNKPSLATVATTGDYDDLIDKPTIPAAQVNSDWDAESGIAQILNKPTFATVATSGSYDDLTNKPTIPSLTPVDITSLITVTKTSGEWSIDSYSAFKSGQTVQFTLTLKGNGNTVNAGSNGFMGSIDLYRPVVALYTPNFSGGTPLIGAVYPGGNIIARVCTSNVTLSSSQTTSFAFLYLTNEV